MPEIVDYLFKFHKKGNHVVSYGICNQEVGETSYYQYANTDGYWYVMKAVRSSAVTVYTYSVPVSIDTTTIADGWTGRAALTFKTFDLAFA